MSAIFKVPTECILQILEYLLIPDMLAFQLTCGRFNALVQENTFSVYRAAAIAHRYVPANPPPATIEEALSQHKDWSNMEDIECWKQFCQVRWRTDQAWKRTTFPKETFIAPQNDQSFARILRDGTNMLLPTDRRRDFWVVDFAQPGAQHTIAVQGQRNDANVATQVATGDLHASGEGIFILKIKARQYGVRQREVPWKDIQGSALKSLGTFNLDGRCETMKMRGKVLMLVTERNTLYIFDFNELLQPKADVSGDGDPTAQQEIEPTLKSDITFYGSSSQEPAFTNAIDFDDKCIFHCTNQGVRILSRSTLEELYSIRNSGWQKVAPSQWAKCFTSNVYCLQPMDVGVQNPGRQQAHGPNRVQKICLKKGVNVKRKSSDWRWDTLNVVVEDRMVIFATPGGWIVALPDYEKLLSGEWDVDDGKGAWALDLGSSCIGVAFDGRRIVCMEGQRHVILNLHELPGRNISVDTPVVRFSQTGWITTGTINNLNLDDRSFSFLAVLSDWTEFNSALVRWIFE